MTKKQLLSALALSTLTLAQSGFVSADEVTPADPSSSSTEVVTPVEPSAPVETPTEPVEPANPTPPVEPTDPSTPTGPSMPTDPVVPVDTSTPGTSTEPSDNDGNNGHPTTPGTTDPSTNGNGGTTPTPPSPSEEPKNPAPMPEPNQTFEPFETNGGQTVVGTQNSQVVVQEADGSTQLVSAEEVGGITNPDGTVTLTTATGDMKTLPETGEESTGLLSVIGAVLLGAIGFITKKKFI